MSCQHTDVEREAFVTDGLCGVCLQEQIETLREDLKAMTDIANDLRIMVRHLKDVSGAVSDGQSAREIIAQARTKTQSAHCAPADADKA